MEQKIKVKPNQSFLDVILQACGTLEDGMLIALDNGLPISYFPLADNDIIISDTIATNSDDEVLMYLQHNGIIIGTKAESAVEAALITEDGDDDLVTEDGLHTLVDEF